MLLCDKHYIRHGGSDSLLEIVKERAEYSARVLNRNFCGNSDN
jgi:hypothetical protein